MNLHCPWIPSASSLLAALCWAACSIGMTILNKLAVTRTGAPMGVVMVQICEPRSGTGPSQKLPICSHNASVSIMKNGNTSMAKNKA